MKLGYIPPMTRDLTTKADYVIPLVEMLEEVGVESVWTVEHVVMAQDYEPLYPYSEDGRAPAGEDTQMPDPLEWLAFAAARTSQIRLATSVVVASQHSAAILAKRAATLDALSGGRLTLGVGLGWQKEEYAAVGVPYSDRGRRLDECIEAMRVLWQDEPATYHGRHVEFTNVVCDTKPARAEGVPIVIGGSSDFAAKRAGRLGDGFYPYVISPDDYAERIETIHRVAREHGRSEDEIELSVWPGSYDFTRTFDLDFVRSYADLGITRTVVGAPEGGDYEIENQREFLLRYREQVIDKL